MSSEANTIPVELLRQRVVRLEDEIRNLRHIAMDLATEHICPERSRHRFYVEIDRECARCRGEGALRHYEHIRNTRYV